MHGSGRSTQNGAYLPLTWDIVGRMPSWDHISYQVNLRNFLKRTRLKVSLHTDYGLGSSWTVLRLAVFHLFFLFSVCVFLLWNYNSWGTSMKRLESCIATFCALEPQYKGSGCGLMGIRPNSIWCPVGALRFVHTWSTRILMWFERLRPDIGPNLVQRPWFQYKDQHNVPGALTRCILIRLQVRLFNGSVIMW